ncbi:uncharacterized protein TRIADDRAFT_63886 [Trichoplax adhaerens]|uniref:MD-2-related lipid-recognition domain-containing protein n=1 Tax=Trichoplax adhaerens TaxID=10228 RepID=B3RVZ2_TRIAD|nr:hypothetical protein TRIADDRAFT_63886 [Trichoplax adhaerens]EDV26083.1 hypothetical protein TRIADDRAFT_63886 [Trichoplax adhaerens]|eukprot:XP_002112116.1 hypothetical protein TRIADDRAFT_63886 [Trichoplax adhaerens]
MSSEKSEETTEKKSWQIRKKHIIIAIIALIVFYIGYKFYPVKGTDVIRKISKNKKKVCGSAKGENQMYWKKWLNDPNKVEIGDVFRPCPSSNQEVICDREILGKIALVVDQETERLNVTYRAKTELEYDITKAGIHLKVTIDGLSAVDKQLEMCKMSNLTHISCPVRKGLLKLHDSFALPKLLMKGSYSAEARLTNQHGDDIACLNVQFDI